MNNKTLVYPFDNQTLPLLRHKAYPQDIHISAIVSPKGWGLVGKDAGAIDYGEALGIQITGSFEDALENCTTVFFVQPEFPLPKEKVTSRIFESISAGKNILCTYPLDQAEFNQFQKETEERGLEFRYLSNHLDHLKLTSAYIDKFEIESKPLHTPVVMIFGLIEQVGKFDTQLAFTEYLTNLGYKASLICSRPYGKLFGARSVPSFMFNTSITERDKIVLFNNFVKNIEDEESPDIFVIGVPGGIIPLNNKVTNRYGITAYEMTREIMPDAAILCTYFERYTKDYIEQLNTLCKYRFSTEFTTYIVNNTALDLSSRDTPDKVSTMPIETHKIDSAIRNDYPVPVFSRSNRISAFECVIDKLSNFSEVEAF